MKLLGKKNSQAAVSNQRPRAEAIRKGRPLILFFLPLMFAASLVVVGLAAWSAWSRLGTVEDTEVKELRFTAKLLTEQIADRIATSRRLLAVVARDPRVVAALEDAEPEALTRLGQSFTSTVPGFTRIRLLPTGWDRPDISAPAPMGYAGVDLVRRTAERGVGLPVEVHQTQTEVPYIAVTEPVFDRGRVTGVLFGALALELASEPIDALDSPPGGVEVRQGSKDPAYILAQRGRLAGESLDNVQIAGSIWELRSYRPTVGWGDVPLLEVLLPAGLALLLIAALGFLQWRSLASALEVDMTAAQAWCGNLLHGGKAEKHQTRVRATDPLLIELYELVGVVKRPGGAPAPAVDDSLLLPSLAARKTEADRAAPTPAATPSEIKRSGDSVKHQVMPVAAFRANDIRGIYGEVLTTANVRTFGCALATHAAQQGSQRFLVGRDARLSSPELTEALIDGLLRAGCDVTDVGQVPTPLLYYGVHEAGVDAGVMVTGSHNPAEYNGLKIVIGGQPLAGDELLKLRGLMETCDFREGLGQRDEMDLVADYMGRILDELSLGRTLKLVVDGSNGVAGEVAVHLYESLGCEVIRLHCEPNGRFPNHAPDPTRLENLTDLQELVVREKADLGIAFDGDGDRVVMVDDQGQFVWPEHVLMLLTADILIRHPGVDVLYDVKSSRNLASYILASGGRPIICKSGHAPMKTKMRETGALLGGEFSGQYYIKERWYGFDDGIYTAARLLELLSVDMRSFSEILEELPSSEATPELFVPVALERQPELMQALLAKARFPEAKLIDIDGLRVEFPGGWGLVRASNTEPAMVFRFEASDRATLDDIKSKFRQLLRDAAPDLVAPF